MNTVHPSPFLRAALWLDASASGAVALAQLGAAVPLAGWTGLAQALLVETGVLMLGWVALLAWLARHPRPPRALLQAVIGGNLAWALAAAALAVLLRPPLPGLALLALHTLPVAGFALLQAMGLSRSAPAPAH
ncbi:MAG: hypothetical protein U1F56_08015 [Rubrivivax sp.]